MSITAHYNIQDRNATQVPINRRLAKKKWYRYHKGILLNHKKEWDSAICNMDGPRGFYA